MSEGQMQPGWYHAQGDDAGTERYWDGQQWVGEPRVKPQPAGWYHAKGDPEGTRRYWDGQSWQGPPQPIPGVDAGEVVTDSGTLADPVTRLQARAIDGVAWLFVAVTALWSSASVFLIVAIAAFAYEVVMTGMQGATLGKRLSGIRLVREDQQPVDYVTAATRMAIYGGIAFICFVLMLGDITRAVVGLFFLIGIGVGIYTILNDGKRQAPWDKMAKTLVVKG